MAAGGSPMTTHDFTVGRAGLCRHARQVADERRRDHDPGDGKHVAEQAGRQAYRAAHRQRSLSSGTMAEPIKPIASVRNTRMGKSPMLFGDVISAKFHPVKVVTLSWYNG
jgi:hypothetical protein